MKFGEMEMTKRRFRIFGDERFFKLMLGAAAMEFGFSGTRTKHGVSFLMAAG
ncbi:hypothetical protein G7076_02675 [Sphingomonas sp. HDW15A]|uniref:hypothetical protein n=1 Tax=Sphingomonas sp. HDW15A TaxID=2714942 RepID=UPI001408410C|nr:hypothetical protein [Sphingomonas sp. HDW15A]QIK95529.1 hypothetical protein G7076_02675 [Sphingomonas sp. HDW15A]